MTWWRRVGPWLPLGVITADIVLVWSGVLPLRDAVIAGLCLEALSWTVLITRLVTAARCYRRARADGVPGWTAIELATGQVMPARLARLMVYEPRMWACLARWLTGHRPARSPGAAAYHRDKTLLFAALAGLLGFEALLAHVLLLVIVGSTWWVWALFVIDVYTLAWVLGFYASLVVLPHHLDGRVLRLRYGYISEVTIPRAAIREVRAVTTRPGNTKGKLMIDPDTGTGRYTSDAATVAIDLEPSTRVTYRGLPVNDSIHTLYVTADNPASVAAAWNVELSVSP